MKFRKFISILLAFVMVVMTLGLTPAAALADAPAAESEDNLQPDTSGEPEQSGESRNRDSRRHRDRGRSRPLRGSWFYLQRGALCILKGKSDGLPIELFQNIEEGLKAFSLIFFVSA